MALLLKPSVKERFIIFAELKPPDRQNVPVTPIAAASTAQAATFMCVEVTFNTDERRFEFSLCCGSVDDINVTSLHLRLLYIIFFKQSIDNVNKNVTTVNLQ